MAIVASILQQAAADTMDPAKDIYTPHSRQRMEYVHDGRSLDGTLLQVEQCPSSYL